MSTVYSYHRLRAGFDGELDEELAGVREHAAQHAEPKGYTWGGSFIDAPGMRTTCLFARPEGKRLRAKVRLGDLVLVPTQSTGFASISDFLRVVRDAQRCGWHLAVADVGYATWLPEADSLIAAFERQADADRQRRAEGNSVAHATRRELGRAKNQHAGYGYKLVGPRGRRRVVPDPDEQSVMATILELRRAGKSVGDIARGLMLAGVVTRRGVEWSPSRVARALVAAEAMYRDKKGAST